MGFSVASNLLKIGAEHTVSHRNLKAGLRKVSLPSGFTSRLFMLCAQGGTCYKSKKWPAWRALGPVKQDLSSLLLIPGWVGRSAVAFGACSLGSLPLRVSRCLYLPVSFPRVTPSPFPQHWDPGGTGILVARGRGVAPPFQT